MISFTNIWFAVNFIFAAEIILIEQEVIVVKGTSDCRFIVCGPVEEVVYSTHISQNA